MKDNEESGAVVVIDGGQLSALHRSEIEQQIATARKYPRQLSSVRNMLVELVTYSPEVADSCIFALTRKDKNELKTIEGPSIRFAEMLVYAWGNCRVQSRLIDIGERHVTAQGVFHDLESNMATSGETQRSIWGNYGRFRDDIVMMTANAAGSVAKRNAILSGIPQGIWMDAYERARKTAIGEGHTFVAIRDQALKVCAKAGAPVDVVLARFKRQDVSDISGSDVVTIKGLLAAIREGETTVEEAFDMKGGAPKTDAGKTGDEAGPRRKSETEAAKQAAAAKGDAKPGDEAPKGGTGTSEATGAPQNATQEVLDEKPVEEVVTMDLAGYLRKVDQVKDLDDLALLHTSAAEDLGARDIKVLKGAINTRMIEFAGKLPPLDNTTGADLKFADEVSVPQRSGIEKKLLSADRAKFVKAFPVVTLDNIGSALKWLRDSAQGTLA